VKRTYCTIALRNYRSVNIDGGTAYFSDRGAAYLAKAGE